MATLNCPYCGKLTDPNLDGCPHCGGYIKKKAGAIPKAPKKTEAHCPSCKGPVEDGDIICVACGTNLLTGQKIADAPKIQDSSSGSSLPAPSVIIAWVVGLCAIILVIVGIYVLTNNPAKRAQKYIANAQYPEAQELLSEIVEDDPENETAHFELAKLQRRATQYNDAAGSFKRVVELNPSHPHAGLLAVLSLQETKRTSVLSDQITLLKQFTDQHQDVAQAWYLLGMAYGTRGNANDVEQQILALEQAISLSPDMEAAELGLGIAETLRGNYPEAEKHLSMISTSEYKGDAQASLGYIADFEEKFELSMEHFSKALATGEFSTRTHAQVQLAKVLLQLGEFNPAETQLKDALQSDPSNALGRYLLGIAIQSQGRANEAIVEYQTLVKASNGYEGLAAVQLASLQMLLGNIDDAQRSITAARRAKINTPAYHTVHGRIYIATDSSPQAISSFDTAIKQDPGYASAYMERGLCYISLGKLELGLKDLKSYLTLIGPDTRGTKARDIRMLANQLQNTLGR